MPRAASAIHAFPFPTRAPGCPRLRPGITAKRNAHSGAGGSPAERNAFLKATQAPRGRRRPLTERALPPAPALPPRKPCPLAQEAGHQPPLCELAFGVGPRGGGWGERRSPWDTPAPPRGRGSPFLADRLPLLPGAAPADRTGTSGPSAVSTEELEPFLTISLHMALPIL